MKVNNKPDAGSTNPLDSDPVNSHIAKAEATLDLNDKRIHYQAAYAEFRKAGKLSIPFFKFLELYAAKTCYAQENPQRDAAGKSIDPDEGFRKSARLCELSALLQLNELGLVDFKFQWAKFEQLEALINSLEGFEISVAPEVLAARATEGKEVLRATLIRIAYSHQNFSGEGFAFHDKYNRMIEALFDQTTPQGKFDAMDFKYNRCGLMIKLKDNSLERKKEAYGELLQQYESFQSSDPVLNRAVLGKISQINNMMGILLGDAPEAATYFQEAFQAREKLFKESRHSDDEYFLCNIRTGMISTLLARGDLEGAKPHADALKSYIAENRKMGNNHSYLELYQKAVDKIY